MTCLVSRRACVLGIVILALVGCGETTGAGGSGGGGSGAAGTGGDGGSGGGGMGGTDNMPECQSPEDCDDTNGCTASTCNDGTCQSTPVADRVACGGNAGTCQQGSCVGTFACTEQGIRDAIAVGGGPHTFDCDGATTVVTAAEIVIDNDVILDGEGNLTVNGNGNHSVLSVAEDMTAELRGFGVTNGSAALTEAGSYGGGIRNLGKLTLAHSMVSENTAYQAGGGIYNEGMLTLLNSTVSGNSAWYGTGGGGIYNADSATVTLRNSTVLGNTASGSHYFSGEDTSGGGIYNEGMLTLLNSTVSGNSASHGGGGIRNLGMLTLTQSTVSGNGIENSGTLTLMNTLVHNGGCDGTAVSGGGNLENPGNTCGLIQPTDLVNVTAEDLSLVPLAHFGGATQTHALLRGSVAIDRIPVSMCVDADGQPLTTDQRGVSHPQEVACDVGAFEWVDCTGSVCDDGDDCTADTCSPIDGTCGVSYVVMDGTACDFEGAAGLCIAAECVANRWAMPVLLETGQLWGVQVAVDPNGQAIAVWLQGDGSAPPRDTIWAKRFTPDDGWGTAVPMETNRGSAGGPHVAVDANGNATAVWSQQDGNRNSIWSNQYTPSGGWGTAVLLDDKAYNPTAQPSQAQVAVDPNGNATAVWNQYDGTHSSIWSNRYTPSGGWGTPVSLETDDTEAWDAQIAVDSNGHAMVVWQGGRVDSNIQGWIFSIWSNRYTPSAGWGTALLLSDTSQPGGAQVAVDPNGNATVVWNAANRIWSKLYTPSAGWGTSVLMNTGGQAFSPQVTMDAQGNAVAVWVQSYDNRDGIWSNRYTPSAGWGTAGSINTGAIGRDPQVAVDPDGNVTTVWSQDENGTGGSIWANRYTPSAGWGTAVPIETNRGSARGPHVAVDASGSAVAVWVQEGGVWSNRFE